jgi:uncharacterized protein YcbX
MHVGRVAQIWRYPVKSMAGERLTSTPVEVAGLPGDRAWAVRDEERGGIRGAKKLPELMRCAARYLEEPRAERAGDAEMRLADGTVVRTDDPEAAAHLSRVLGTRVTLWPLQPADRLEHFRRGAPTHADLEQEMRSLDALARLAPESRIDVRRFRPNFVLDVPDGPTGFPEAAWAGRRIRLGSMTAEVTIPCMRCVMTTLPVDELPKDPRIMRTMVRETKQCLGAYARVVEPGVVRLGDAAELL